MKKADLKILSISQNVQFEYDRVDGLPKRRFVVMRCQLKDTDTTVNVTVWLDRHTVIASTTKIELVTVISGIEELNTMIGLYVEAREYTAYEI